MCISLVLYICLIMTQSTEISKLTVGGVLATADEFDLGVRRVNQDRGKLVRTHTVTW